MIRAAYFGMAAASVIAGILFAVAAWSVARRQHSAEFKAPAIAFVVSWAGLALIAFNDAARILSASFDPVAVTAYHTLARVKIITTGAVIWGFGVYVAYLWTGTTRGWTSTLGVAAAAHSLLFLALVERNVPEGVALGTYLPRMTFAESEGLSPLAGLLVLALYFAPAIVLALLYARLGGRVKASAIRFRLIATALAIITFQVAGFFHANPDLSGSEALFPTLGIAMVIAGVVAATAYFPPLWVRRRFGTPYSDPSLGEALAAEQRSRGGSGPQWPSGRGPP